VGPKEGYLEKIILSLQAVPQKEVVVRVVSIPSRVVIERPFLVNFPSSTCVREICSIACYKFYQIFCLHKTTWVSRIWDFYISMRHFFHLLINKVIRNFYVLFPWGKLHRVLCLRQNPRSIWNIESLLLPVSKIVQQ
jgi:hypothetical protein